MESRLASTRNASISFYAAICGTAHQRLGKGQADAEAALVYPEATGQRIGGESGHRNVLTAAFMCKPLQRLPHALAYAFGSFGARDDEMIYIKETTIAQAMLNPIAAHADHGVCTVAREGPHAFPAPPLQIL